MKCRCTQNFFHPQEQECKAHCIEPDSDLALAVGYPSWENTLLQWSVFIICISAVPKLHLSHNNQNRETTAQGMSSAVPLLSEL